MSKLMTKRAIKANVMRAFAIASVLTTPCHADEAQDALDTLSFALQCPISPDTINGWVSSNQFSGNRSVLRVEEKWSFNDGGTTTNLHIAKFADLGSTQIVPPNGHQVFSLQYACQNGKKCVKSSQQRTGIYSGVIEPFF